jgi:transcription initiation factor IIE alpha subunit
MTQHSIGFDSIGGFEGHEHFHITGEQKCFNCGRTLTEIIENKLIECDERELNELKKSIDLDIKN